MTISNRTARIVASALVAGTALLAGATGASAAVYPTGVPPIPACTSSIAWSWRHLPYRVMDCTRVQAYTRVMKAFNGSRADQTAAFVAVMTPYRNYGLVRDHLKDLPAAASWNRAAQMCVRDGLLNVMQIEGSVAVGHQMLSFMNAADQVMSLARDLRRTGVPWESLVDQVSVDYYKVGGQVLTAGANLQVANAVQQMVTCVAAS